MDKVFEQLMKLPLFQGVSSGNLEKMVETIPFHFLKYNVGTTINTVGDPCTHVRFVFTGTVKVTFVTVSKLTVEYQLPGPDVINPAFLFGIHTVYPFNVIATTDCGLLQVKKDDFVQMLQADQVVLFNYLNFLSRGGQVEVASMAALAYGSIAERLGTIVAWLTPQSASNIVIQFKLRDLCRMLSTRRSALFATLNALQDDGILTYTPNSISIIDRKRMLEMRFAENR
ncbi:MAG: Crp/Fnr family transcriptional regulator [Muribaculaceae bacterium]|nr:Crp/Fnr family transcriptional regulator [Muribaculaceae bacterium]